MGFAGRGAGFSLLREGITLFCMTIDLYVVAIVFLYLMIYLYDETIILLR
jgi:hypothetical protein